MEAAPHPWPALGVLLMRDGLVEKDELEEILAEQRDSRQQRVSGRRLGEVLIQRGRVTPTQVAKLVAEQYELPFVDFDVADIDLRAAWVMSEDDARRHWALPINRTADGSFLLAIADPATVLFSDELRRLLGSAPRFAVVGPDAIEQAISYVYSQPIPTFTVAPEPSASADDLIVMAPEHTHVLDQRAEDLPHGPPQAWPPLGALLLRDGLVTDDELETALAQQRLAPSLRLGEILTGKGLVTRGDVSRLVAEQYELPFYELERIDIDPEVVRRLPEELAWRLHAIPIAALEDGSVMVAIADPTSAVYSDDLHLALDVPLELVVASPDDIEATLDRVYEPVLELPASDDAETPLEHHETGLEVTEPPLLVVEATVTEIAAPLTEADESWTGRLELVEETAQDELPEHAEHDVTELPWEPAAEMVSPLDLHAPAVAEAEAEVVELHTEEPTISADAETHAADEPEAEEAEVYEFAWPAMPEAELPEEELAEPSLADALALQVAEAIVADAVEVDGSVAFDIFGVGSRAAAAAPTLPEDTDGEVAAEPTTATVAYLPTPPEHSGEDAGEVADVPDVEVDAPAYDFETFVRDALAAGASAIHFSPRDDHLAVRARIDGVLHDLGTAALDERDILVERLETEGIVRTHTVATSRGTKTTLFVRERPGAPTSLDDLALDSDAPTVLRAALERPSGAVLVCGPAGHGTTTTLYALLEALASPERAVATVEHPVERLLGGVDQIDVRPDESFAAILRELRLTDTDALLVGDLPDRDTASSALSAAYEGRLVVAGFHAPGAVAGLLRLVGLGVEPALLASSVGCVVSQRLVRTVCGDCRETYYASDEELELLGQSDSGNPRLLVRGAGCETCGGTGYRGRTAILEILTVTDDLRGLIADGASAKKLQKAAVAAGMSPLRDEGTRLCLDGVTTAAEVTNVLGDGS